MDEAAEAEESRPSEVTVLLMKDEIARLDEIIGYANEIEGETKVATLIKLIETRLEPEEPLLLFTEYKATQALVLSKLEAHVKIWDSSVHTVSGASSAALIASSLRSYFSSSICSSG